MKKSKDLSRLIVAGILTAAILIGFSVPWGIIPPLGTLFNPNGGLWSINHKSPPTMSLEIPNLTGDVTVIKDEWGIPHIYAEHESDAYCVMGYLHAYDRLFQLEMTKRQISGTLSEVVGESTLSTDKYFRNLQLRKNAQLLDSYMQESEPKLYAYLEAYIAGLNFRIQEVKDLPFEFQFLGIKPSLWEPIDVLQIQNYMSYMLTYSDEDLWRSYLRLKIEDTYPTAMAELFPARTPFQVPISPDYGAYPDQPSMASLSFDTPENALLLSITMILDQHSEVKDMYGSINRDKGIGSNNWVVAANKSATGAPILCNDMHLEWGLPMIWYEAHIVASETQLNVQGFTIPGVPFVIVGHNKQIAWGFTNAGMDHIDFYYYSGNSSHYWYAPEGKYLAYESYIESIPVKGKNPVQFEIKESIHGPLLSNNRYSDVATPIAFKWVTLSNLTRTFAAIYGFNHAQNFTAFNTSLADFAIPSQNVIYADIDGNIAIRSTGWVPIRAGVTRDSDIPRFIINGSAGLYEWMGFIPTNDLPHSINPSQGYLVSANHWNAGPSYPYYTQASAANYRGTRINQLLANNPQVSVSDMQIYHLDDFNLVAEWFVPLILNVYANSSVNITKTTPMNQALELLLAWNNSIDQFRMKTNLAGPTIFKAIFDQFSHLIFKDEFVPLLGTSLEGIDAAILQNMSINNPNSKWFDINGTEKVERRDDIIAVAIVEGFNFLATNAAFKQLSPDMWLYGKAHTAIFSHIAGLPGFGKGPYSVNGSGNTVNPSYAGLFQSANWGASERMIIDFSQTANDFNTSLIVIPGGSSGDPVSPHYADQLQLFLEGKYHKLNYISTVAAFPTSIIENKWIITGGN
jgi:penicillin amidase